MYFNQITEPKLAHNAYLIGCQESGEAIIIDPMRDIDRYITIAEQDNLKIVAATETHIHADYLSGLREFAEHGEVTIYASDEGDDDWKYEWLIGSSIPFGLLKQGDQINVGSVSLTVAHTPGHTPEHISFLLTDTQGAPTTPIGILTGDFVFVGDVGRPDLLETAASQKGNMLQSAAILFESLQTFRTLPPELILWPGHGAGSACGRSLGAAPVSTVGNEIMTNLSLHAATDTDSFVEYILKDQPEPPSYFGRMKELNRSGPAILNSLPKPKQTDGSELDSILVDKDRIIIDSRSWEEFRAGHLDKSLFIPLESAFSTLIGSYARPNESILLVADSSDIVEIVRDCIRVGIDNITHFISPDDLRKFTDDSNKLVTVNEIDMSQLSKRLESSKVSLVDVRRASELAETGRIGNAYNIAHTQLLLHYKQLPDDKNLHVYCRSGNRSRYASAFLERCGLTVTHVTGGILEWMEINQPVQRDSSKTR